MKVYLNVTLNNMRCRLVEDFSPSEKEWERGKERQIVCVCVCVCCIKSQEKDAGIFCRLSYEHSLFASLPFLNDSQIKYFDLSKSNIIANIMKQTKK